MIDRRTPIRPTEAYADTETAIRVMCKGCERGMGWLSLANGWDAICPGMLAIRDDVPGSVVVYETNVSRNVTCPLKPGWRF